MRLNYEVTKNMTDLLSIYQNFQRLLENAIAPLFMIFYIIQIYLCKCNSYLKILNISIFNNSYYLLKRN